VPKSLSHEQESGRKWQMDVRLEVSFAGNLVLHRFDLLECREILYVVS
jgi:hypothetical protein